MQREEVERVVWKVLTKAMQNAALADRGGLAVRPRAEDVDLIMTYVDACVATVRQHRGKRPLHYAPMPAIETACGIISAGNKQLRLTGSPADVECENCKATDRWRNDMTVERVRYG